MLDGHKIVKSSGVIVARNKSGSAEEPPAGDEAERSGSFAAASTRLRPADQDGTGDHVSTSNPEYFLVLDLPDLEKFHRFLLREEKTSQNPSKPDKPAFVRVADSVRERARKHLLLAKQEFLAAVDDWKSTVFVRKNSWAIANPPKFHQLCRRPRISSDDGAGAGGDEDGGDRDRPPHWAPFPFRGGKVAMLPLRFVRRGSNPAERFLRGAEGGDRYGPNARIRWPWEGRCSNNPFGRCSPTGTSKTNKRWRRMMTSTRRKRMAMEAYRMATEAAKDDDRGSPTKGLVPPGGRGSDRGMDDPPSAQPFGNHGEGPSPRGGRLSSRGAPPFFDFSSSPRVEYGVDDHSPSLRSPTTAGSSRAAVVGERSDDEQSASAFASLFEAASPSRRGGRGAGRRLKSGRGAWRPSRRGSSSRSVFSADTGDTPSDESEDDSSSDADEDEELGHEDPEKLVEGAEDHESKRARPSPLHVDVVDSNTQNENEFAYSDELLDLSNFRLLFNERSARAFDELWNVFFRRADEQVPGLFDSAQEMESLLEQLRLLRVGTNIVSDVLGSSRQRASKGGVIKEATEVEDLFLDAGLGPRTTSSASFHDDGKQLRNDRAELDPDKARDIENILAELSDRCVAATWAELQKQLDKTELFLEIGALLSSWQWRHGRLFGWSDRSSDGASAHQSTPTTSSVLNGASHASPQEVSPKSKHRVKSHDSHPRLDKLHHNQQNAFNQSPVDGLPAGPRKLVAQLFNSFAHRREKYRCFELRQLSPRDGLPAPGALEVADICPHSGAPVLAGAVSAGRYGGLVAGGGSHSTDSQVYCYAGKPVHVAAAGDRLFKGSDMDSERWRAQLFERLVNGESGPDSSAWGWIMNYWATSFGIRGIGQQKQVLGGQVLGNGAPAPLDSMTLSLEKSKCVQCLDFFGEDFFLDKRSYSRAAIGVFVSAVGQVGHAELEEHLKALHYLGTLRFRLDLIGNGSPESEALQAFLLKSAGVDTKNPSPGLAKNSRPPLQAGTAGTAAATTTTTSSKSFVNKLQHTTGPTDLDKDSDLSSILALHETDFVRYPDMNIGPRIVPSTGKSVKNAWWENEPSIDEQMMARYFLDPKETVRYLKDDDATVRIFVGRADARGGKYKWRGEGHLHSSGSSRGATRTQLLGGTRVVKLFQKREMLFSDNGDSPSRPRRVELTLGGSWRTGQSLSLEERDFDDGRPVGAKSEEADEFRVHDVLRVHEFTCSITGRRTSSRADRSSPLTPGRLPGFPRGGEQGGGSLHPINLVRDHSAASALTDSSTGSALLGGYSSARGAASHAVGCALIPCYSFESGELECSGRIGSSQDHIEDALSDSNLCGPDKHVMYLCGNAELVGQGARLWGGGAGSWGRDVK